MHLIQRDKCSVFPVCMYVACIASLTVIKPFAIVYMKCLTLSQKSNQVRLALRISIFGCYCKQCDSQYIIHDCLSLLIPDLPSAAAKIAQDYAKVVVRHHCCYLQWPSTGRAAAIMYCRRLRRGPLERHTTARSQR